MINKFQDEKSETYSKVIIGKESFFAAQPRVSLVSIVLVDLFINKKNSHEKSQKFQDSL
jgi:hypothetical protein